jgi:hypothetical protein
MHNITPFSDLPCVGTDSMILVDFADIIEGMPSLAGCGSKVHLRMPDRLQPRPSSLTGSFITEAPNAN